MLSYELFSGFAFPFRVQRANDGLLIKAENGALFRQPQYRDDQEKFWTTITPGWQRCPAGFAVYVVKVHPDSTDLLIIHGLKINGISTTRGRSDEISINLDKERFKEYVDNFLSAVDSANIRLSTILAESIHEIRSVNSALYNAGYELQNRLTGQGIEAALSKNITALSEVLSLRMELIDFLAAYSTKSSFEVEEIPVFKKFDKLCKCFRALAKTRNVDIQVVGSSLGVVLAARSFELIPLLVLDNALKYSPDNQSINVAFSESQSDISCTVTSIGPMIKDEEKDRIFQLGERGEFARKSGSSGSGIGLFFLRSLINTAGGTIFLHQDDKMKLNVKGIPHRNTECRLVFPKFVRGSVSFPT